VPAVDPGRRAHYYAVIAFCITLIFSAFPFPTFRNAIPRVRNFQGSKSETAMVRVRANRYHNTDPKHKHNTNPNHNHNPNPMVTRYAVWQWLVVVRHFNRFRYSLPCPIYVTFLLFVSVRWNAIDGVGDVCLAVPGSWSTRARDVTRIKHSVSLCTRQWSWMHERSFCIQRHPGSQQGL